MMGYMWCSREKINAIVSNALLNKTKYNDLDLIKSIDSCIDSVVERFCFGFVLEYTRYLFLSNKVDSKSEFYRFCMFVEDAQLNSVTLHEINRHEDKYICNLHDSISGFICLLGESSRNLFGCDILGSEEEFVPKALEIILDKLNELRMRKDIR
jgi:hypothetical protein